MDMWKLPWRPLPFHYYQRVTVEQLMHAIGSSPSVLTGYLSLAPEMKRRTWIMESCPVKVSMTGLKLGKVKFLASRFERHNIRIWKWEVSNDKIFEHTGFYCCLHLILRCLKIYIFLFEQTDVFTKPRATSEGQSGVFCIRGNTEISRKICGMHDVWGINGIGDINWSKTEYQVEKSFIFAIGINRMWDTQTHTTPHSHNPPSSPANGASMHEKVLWVSHLPRVAAQ